MLVCRRWRGVVCGLLVVLSLASSVTLAGDDRLDDAYWSGLIAMRSADWTAAGMSFGRAIAVDPADPRPRLARGIVRAVTGDFPAARDDLNRARFTKSREPQLWLHAVDAMSGTNTGDRGIPIPRSLQQPGGPTSTFSGVPGHIVQGGDDYRTDYASAVIYELAMPYRTAREARQRLDSDELNAARRKVGRWFANRMLATAAMSSRNLAEAKRLVDRGEFVVARELLDLALSVDPGDVDVRLASADLWLRVGRPATARREYTIVATLRTDLAAAYAGRAEAAAMLGDARTARDDLGHAGRYGVVSPSLAIRIERLLAEHVVEESPERLHAELNLAAARGASIDTLVPIAKRLHAVTEATRTRYDELYQLTVRRLTDAVRGDARAIGPRVELAQYLHDESDPRGIEIEPRRGRVPFRWQGSREAELGVALGHVETALRIDPDHVPALVTRAFVLTALDRGNEAERSIDRAMELAKETNADAVRLLARYRRKQIAGLLSAARANRTPSFTTTTDRFQHSDGVRIVRRTTRFDPSSDDLARAAALQAEAERLIRETRALMESAVAATRGTLDGLLLESAYEDWFGSKQKALESLEQAVAEYPKEIAAHDALVDYLRETGRVEESLRRAADGWQLVHTTAAPLLRLAWVRIARDGWPALAGDLERARNLDPVDALVTAYLAMARLEARDARASETLLRVAVALERARLERDDRGPAREWSRRPEDLANAMQLHQELGQALANAGRRNEALEQFVASGDLALRFPPDGLAAPMFEAMRPDPAAPAFPGPEPPNGATLASRAHLGAARALQAVGRGAEARKYLLAAAEHTKPHDSMVPNIGSGRPGDTNFGGRAEGASATALIELAKEDIAAGRYREAMQRLQDATQAGPTREQRGEINQMILREVLPRLQGQR